MHSNTQPVTEECVRARAVCGTPSMVVTQTFVGNGTCTMTVEINSDGARITDCSRPLFPDKTCRTFAGDIHLTISNAAGATAETYVPPRIDESLASVGLGSLQTISGNLVVVVNHDPNLVPVDLAPTFLSSLRNINGLTVKEVGTESYSCLTGLPGLSGVKRLAVDGHLQVVGTAFPDLSSLSGLVCPPGSLDINSNGRLTNLDGLSGLGPWTANGKGPVTSITDNALRGPASIAGLSTLAGCPSTTLVGEQSPVPSPNIFVYNGAEDYCLLTVSPFMQELPWNSQHAFKRLFDAAV